MTTTNHPVDSATRPCCDGIGTHTRDCATVDGTHRYAYAGHCIVGCGWIGVEGDHGPYCERSIGGSANGVTEPTRTRTEFWCSVIRANVDGSLTDSAAREFRRDRDGIQLAALVDGVDIAFDTETQTGWSEVRFNLTSAEARSLAAHLIAAADSHDNLDASEFITRRLDKLAKRLGVDITGA